MSTTITTCFTCQLPVVQTDAQPIRVLMPTGRHHNGVELLQVSATLFECNDCLSAEFATSAGDEHIYTVYACSTTKTVSATTPEEAARLMMQAHGCRSTRSVAVIGSGVRCEFLDCELVGGQLRYSEQVNLP